MVGYATSETDELLPLEYVLARSLCKYIFEKYPYDGKTQITVKDNKIKTIVVSFQNTSNQILVENINEWYKKEWENKLGKGDYEILPNQAGEWTKGGFDADTGLSGRKLIVDNYGPQVNIGGGSYSGKDYTKVDRSGAYVARKIAVEILKKNNSKEVYVKLAYAIGKVDPIMSIVIIDGIEKEITDYDLSTSKIRKLLNLDKQKFTDTCKWGHYGNNFTWDK
jgi:S-adenosylmethionine synthetase